MKNVGLFKVSQATFEQNLLWPLFRLSTSAPTSEYNVAYNRNERPAF